MIRIVFFFFFLQNFIDTVIYFIIRMDYRLLMLYIR